MSTKEHFEEAALRIKQLVGQPFITQLQDANEAKTRLLVIDEVLELLGWNKTEYNPEERTSTGAYTDYLLTIDGEPRLIVEAKRIGIVEPLSKNLQRPQYINSFLFNNCGTEMQALLQQCRDYCSDRGVPYALATNGSVWIVLVGFKYGVEWGKLRSFVFHSLNDVCIRFNEFYSLVSRDAIKSNSLEEKFGSIILVKPPVAIRPREHGDYPTAVDSVPDRQIVQAFFDQFLGELVRKREMLEHCYVDNQRLSEFSRELRQLLDYNAALDDLEVHTDDVNEERLEKEVEIQLASERPRTILLVGNIGAGKSTFIQRFALIEAKEKRHACVVINLINESVTSTDQGRLEEQRLAKLILEEIERKFQKKVDPYDPNTLRGCFEIELGRFKKQKTKRKSFSPEEYELQEEDFLFQQAQDSYKHLVGYIKYVRKKGYKPWVAFDNVDRGSESYQEFAYVFAHKLADDAGCVTLITMREDTFLEVQGSGFLDVRSSDIVFKVTAPEFRQIVAKRRRYVERLIEIDQLPKPLKAHTLLITALNWHIKQLVLGNDNSIRLVITTFSLNNIRYALTMLRDYYLSFHSTFHRFFGEIQKNEEHLDELQLDCTQECDRFIQALMLGSSWSYNEQTSGVLNLFAVDRLERTSHFLVLRILAYLNLDMSTLASRTTNCDKIIKNFTFLGYQRHHINTALQKLLQFALVVSPNLKANSITEQKLDVPDPLPTELKLVLSPKGYYYLNSLVRNSYYQARVAEDTIWYNEELANLYIACLKESLDSQNSFDGVDALLATDARELFLQYLRRFLIDEDQTASIRSTSQEWVRLTNEVIERSIFGQNVVSSAYSNEDIGEAEIASSGVGNTVDPDFFSKVKKRPKHKESQLRQEALPGILTDADYEKALYEAVESLGALPLSEKIQKSRYVIRVLWALEVAARAGLGALRASEVSSIINEYGKVTVDAPNVAKFFRNQRKAGEYTHFWREEPENYYTITSTGKKILHSVIADLEDRHQT